MRLVAPLALIVAAICTLASAAMAQRHPELARQYQQGNLEAVIEAAHAGIASDSSDLELQLLLGRALADLNRFEEARAPLEQVLTLDPQRSWPSAWALVYLGRVYDALGDTAAARMALGKAIKLNRTRNATNSARNWSRMLGFDPLYESWPVRRTEHFVFRFAPTLPSEHFDDFAQAHERAYERIVSFFGGAPPRAIQYFVWGEKEIQQTGWRPGYARPEFVLVHTRANQTVGHELTHVISHWAIRPTQKSGLINEGTAVYLDGSGADLVKRAREALARRGIHAVSVEQLWRNWESLPEEVSYPVAGAFVKFLVEEQGKERFLEMFHEQTLEHARAVYGSELDALITRFEAMLLQPPAA